MSKMSRNYLKLKLAPTNSPPAASRSRMRDEVANRFDQQGVSRLGPRRHAVDRIVALQTAAEVAGDALDDYAGHRPTEDRCPSAGDDDCREVLGSARNSHSREYYVCDQALTRQ
jgi:hypothetical protein